MIQKVPVDYVEDPSGMDGYRVLDGIGDHAYVAPHAFGRITAATTAEAGYLVIASETTDEAAQIEILRDFVDRSPGAPVFAAPDPSPSSDPPASAVPGTPVGCAVTTEEVSGVAGIEMVQGAGCTWSAADPDTLYEVLLAEVPLSLFEYLRTEDAIPGVGDEAYSDGGGLYVRVGDRALSIAVATLSLDEQQQRDAAIAIARHAAARLG
jgi:hypothetical protein